MSTPIFDYLVNVCGYDPLERTKRSDVKHIRKAVSAFNKDGERARVAGRERLTDEELEAKARTAVAGPDAVQSARKFSQQLFSEGFAVSYPRAKKAWTTVRAEWAARQ